MASNWAQRQRRSTIFENVFGESVTLSLSRCCGQSTPLGQRGVDAAEACKESSSPSRLERACHDNTHVKQQQSCVRQS